MEQLSGDGPDEIAIAHYRSWVRIGIVAISIGYAIAIAAHFLPGAGPRRFGLAVIMSPEVLVLISAGIAAMVLRRGSTRAAGLIVLGALWLELHSGGMLSGRFMSAGLLALPALVVASGLFLGGSGAVILAAVTAVSFPSAVQLGAVVLRAGPGITAADGFDIVILAVTLLATAAVMRSGLQAYGAVLATARANARRFAAVVENSPNGIILLDGGGHIVSVNSAAARLFAAPPATLIGSRLANWFADTADLQVDQRTEVVVPRADGARVVEAITSPQDVDGTAGLQVTLRDLTAHRAMEIQATQLGRMLEEVPTEIYVVDAATLRLRFVNQGARANLGYAAGEITALEAGVINPGLSRTHIAEFLRGVRRDPAAVNTRSRGVHVRKDGSVYPIETQLSRGTYDGAEVVIVLALDVAARVEAERKHEHLEHQLQHGHRLEAVGQLASGVAHEVNNVLLTIGTHAGILEEDAVDPALLDEVRAIRAAQQRGEAITRRLLAFAHRGVQRASRFAVDELIAEVRPLLEGMLGERHRLEVEREGPATITADPAQIEHVLIHLATNARDAMPDGGIVRVVLGAPDEAGDLSMVSIDVRDTGIGMDEVTRRRMFDPFFTTKGGGGGAGLGLTVVEALVARNNGTLDVQSRPGWGTRMRVRLPAAPDGVEPEPPVASGAVTGARILLVEDDDGARGALARLLGRAGHDVVAVGTVAAALAAMDDGPVNVVVTDLALPDGSGLDLVRRLRATRPSLPVLLITGRIDPDVALEAFDPARDLLLKPFASSLLLRRVADAIRR